MGEFGLVVPKIGGITMVPNTRNEIISMRPIIGWRVCMDYGKLYASIEKDHFPMLLMDQMLDRLTGKGWYYFFIVIRATAIFLSL